MLNLKTVQDMILPAHADHLIDDDECLLLYDLNRSRNLDLPYHYLDSLSEDECKSEFRFDKRDIYRLCDVLKFQKKLGVIMEWFSTKKKLYVFS